MLSIHITTNTCTPEELRITADALMRLAALSTAERTVEGASKQLPLPIPAPEAPPPRINAPLVVDPVAFVGDPVITFHTGAPPPQTAPVDTGLLDSDNLPWDPRIHSEGKLKIGDGRWRKRRGVSDEIVAAVTAELRQIVANAPLAPAMADLAAAPAPATGAMLPPVDPAVVFGAGTAPPPPPPPFVPPVPIAADATDGPTTFNELMARVMAAMSEQRIKQAGVQEACVRAGVQSLAGITAQQAFDPTVVPRVWAEIQKVINQ